MTQRQLHDDAVYARDAFAQALYHRVVYWILERANSELAAEHAFATISVVDIAGCTPESGSGLNNDFGCFCRNYVNECFQELYNRVHFVTPRREYTNEGIEIPNLAFPDNGGCVDMIERHGGLLAILDQTAQMTHSHDGVLLQHLQTQLSRDRFYRRGRLPRTFQVEHCGGSARC